MEHRDPKRLIAEKFIDAWLDGDLTPEDARNVETLLQQDASLRQEYEPLLQLLRSPAPAEPPVDLADRIKSAVADSDGPMPLVHPPNPAFSRRRVLAIGSAMAACLAIVMIGWWSFGTQETAPPPPVRLAENPAPEPPRQPSVTVVVSPWLASAIAQAMTTPAPSIPTSYIAQGLATELTAAFQNASSETVQRRPRTVTPPAASAPAPLEPPPVWFLPPLSNPMGV
jgi:hypothetical protein